MKNPFAEPHCAWRVVAAAIKGQGHEKTGQPCQDAVHWQTHGEGLLFAALADGAGSAKLSEIGSNLAAQTALRALAESFKSPAALCDDARAKAALKAALEAALKALTDEAKAKPAKPGDLATTLLICVAGPDRLAAAQVGDGAVVYADAAGSLHALTKPAAGEYLNETVFLTSEGALERAQFASWSGRASQLALFSDGLQMLALKMPEAAPHAPFFQPLFDWLERVSDLPAARADLERLLRSPRIAERTDDDLTLLLARRMQ